MLSWPGSGVKVRSFPAIWGENGAAPGTCGPRLIRSNTLFLAHQKLLPLQIVLWSERFHALVPGSVHGGNYSRLLSKLAEEPEV